jgi:hypothetical protein
VAINQPHLAVGRRDFQSGRLNPATVSLNLVADRDGLKMEDLGNRHFMRVLIFSDAWLDLSAQIAIIRIRPFRLSRSRPVGAVVF